MTNSNAVRRLPNLRVYNETGKKEAVLSDEQRAKAERTRLKDWITFYRHNMSFFVEHYLGITLYLYQRLWITWIASSTNFLGVASRASAKSWLIAVYSIAKGILYPGSRIVLASSTKQQAGLIISQHARALYDNHPNVRREIKSITTNQNTYEIRFKNGSFVTVVVSGESGRGKVKIINVKIKGVIMKNWEENEVKFLLENYENMSYSDIAKKLNRTRASVSAKANKLGIKKPGHIYTFNDSFFKAPFNEESAYWAGFIFADGSIESKGKKDTGVSIELQHKDIEHLKKLNKALNGNLIIRTRNRKGKYIVGKYTPDSVSCVIRIFSREIVEDLKKIGLNRNKSHNVRLPKFENENITWAFLRGFFDGDGSIWISKSSGKKTPPQLRAKITSGSYHFRQDFSNFLNSNNINNTIIYNEEGLDCIVNGRDGCGVFFSKLYDNASIYLERKYNKYIENKHLLKLPQ